MKSSRNTLLTELYNKQNGKCCYCGDKMILGTEKPNDEKHASIEHKEPRSKGGVSLMWNLAAACRKCNQEKGSKSLIEHLTKITKGDPKIHPMYKYVIK